ncbi:MAG: hypothetical protein H7210_07290 [Pyrinomonadaceae bacterium]|nr:hypothetical protein [Phycisphaerales bacterium]
MALRVFKRVGLPEATWVGGFVFAAVGVALAIQPLPTTINDFAAPGSQPLSLKEQPVSAIVCSFCHGGYAEEEEPFALWSASLMAQAGRDPVFLAALRVANNDAGDGGETCLRCHVPQGWIQGRSTPTDGSALEPADFESVSCSMCHRMVDPEYVPGQSPAADEAILAGLAELPFNPHSANYVIDPLDRRRGPFDMNADWGGSFPFHAYEQSPFHRESSMCATCHDVSLPHYSKQPDGTYAPNAWDTPAPSDDKYTQFPEQRTYSEWTTSLFAQGQVDLNKRFGGDRPTVSSCQDCHMPTLSGGEGCGFDPPDRPDYTLHTFPGANTWIMRAINHLYFESETNLTPERVDDAIARNVEFLQAASDMELARNGSDLTVRIINYSGHKLPTGYVEGRRMWVNVKFLDAANQVIAERGHYDAATADLTTADTKVYERLHGIDPTVSALSGVQAGQSFHLVLNNVVMSDNRIPPMGFTNAAADAVQSGAVGYTYADGQYWDDTVYTIPAGARKAQVTLYYQTSSKAYMEFLRDNANAGAENPGQVAYDMWVMFGKSAPVAMDQGTLSLSCACDWNTDGVLNSQDFFDFIAGFFTDNADFNNSGATDSQDFFDFLTCFFTGCP